MYKRQMAVFFFSMVFASSSFAMDGNLNQQVVPLEVDNRSEIVVTTTYDVLVRHDGCWHRCAYVLPGRIFDTEGDKPPFVNVRPVVSKEKYVRIATAQGNFCVQIEAFDKPPVMIFKHMATRDWKEITEIQNPFALTKITARVLAGGLVKLIQHKPCPQDGRPDVSLLAYEELLGKQEHASAQEILGVREHMNPKEGFQTRMAQLKKNHAIWTESAGIEQLIRWAGQRLILE